MIFFIDVQGTLIDDKYKKPIKNSIEFINKLNEKNIPYIVITNNTKKRSKDFLKYLNSLGFKIDEKNYIDPLMVLTEVLKEKKIAVYGYEEFKNIVLDLGYEIDFKDPKALLLSVKDDCNFDDFSKMIEFLLNGAKLYGMHATSIYVKNSKRYPGVGAILEMLKFSTDKDYKVVGKPSYYFYKEALLKLEKNLGKKLSFKDVTIISDDAKGDLVGAKNLGMKTVLVLSGKIKDKDEVSSLLKDKIDSVYKDIYEAALRLGVL